MYLLTLKASDYLHRIRQLDEMPLAARESVIGKVLRVFDYLPEVSKESGTLVMGERCHVMALVVKHFRKISVRCVAPGEKRAMEMRTLNVGDEVREIETEICPVELERLPFHDGAFSLVVMMDFLENLRHNPVRPLCEALRVLKKDGALVVAADNALRYENVLSLLEGRTLFPPFGRASRAREYTLGELTDLLTSVNFTVTNSKMTYCAPVEGAFRKSREKVADILNLLFPESRGGASLDDLILIRAQPGERWNYLFSSSVFTKGYFPPELKGAPPPKEEPGTAQEEPGTAQAGPVEAAAEQGP